MLQTALTRDTKSSRFLEFATLSDNAVTRTQIERKDGLVFMRAKKRVFKEE